MARFPTQRVMMVMVWSDVNVHRTFLVQDGFARLYNCPRSCTATPNNECKGVTEVYNVFTQFIDMPLLSVEQCTEY